MASARTLAALASLFALAACGGGSGGSSPTPSPSPSPSPSTSPVLNLALYGGASPGIDHLWVTVTGVAMHADASRTYGDGDAGWVVATMATPITVDLAGTSLSQGGAQQIVDQAIASAGTYAQLRLLVAPADPGALTASATAKGLSWNEQVQYTDSSGTHVAPLELANPQAGIRLTTAFTLSANTTTPLAIEWNAHSSLVRRAASGAGVARFTLRDELQLYDQTLLSFLGGDDLTINGSLFDAILGYLDTSQFCTGSDHAGCIHDVVVSATTISADARFHQEARSVNVGSDGKFLLYPLFTTQASYDVVIHGGNMQTMVVRGVVVDPTGLAIPGATPLATTSARIVPVLDTSEHAVTVSNALSPAGSRVFFGQTLSGTGSTTTGDLPYVIAFGSADPASGQVIDTVTLPGGAIRDAAFDKSTLPPTFTAVTQKEGLGAWSVWSRGTLDDDASALATIAATATSVAAPAPVRTSGFTNGTLTLTLTGSASGGADQAEAVVTNAGGTVAVVDVSGLLAGGGSTAITLPTGSVSGSAGAAVYNVAVHTWTASDAFASSRWARVAAPVSLATTSTASATLALP